MAKYLKVPYAADFLSLLNMQCKPHKNFEDGLYYAKAYYYRTYFYCKNDLIAYDRKSNYEVAIFKYDLLKGEHVPLSFSKLKGIIRDEDTFWISVNDQVKFVVTRDTELQDQKRYVTVTNVENGRSLLIADKYDEIYLDFLPPFSYIILPIIQFKRYSIIIHLVDLLSENSYSMEWDLNDVKELINAALKKHEPSSSYIAAKNTILYDSIYNIEHVELDTISTYEKIVGKVNYDEDDNHSKVMTVTFEIKAKSDEYTYNLRGLIINVEWYKDKLIGILHFNRNQSEIRVIKKIPEISLVYSIDNDDEALSSLPYVHSLIKIHELDKTLNSKIPKLPVKIHKDIIYSDSLCYFLRNSAGIEVIRVDEYMKRNYENNFSSIHRYNQYIFMINRFPAIKLFVIDTENNLIAIFEASGSNSRSLAGYRVSYYFYPIEKYGKLLFVHNQLKTITILNIVKLKQVLDKVKANKDDRKADASYEYNVFGINDVMDISYICESYYIYDLILIDIQSVLNFDVKDTYLYILAHYFDNQNYQLYFIVKLEKQDIQTIVLLVWNCLSNEVRFTPVCYYIRTQNNVAIKASTCNLKKLTKRFSFTNNMDLYGIAPSSDGFGKFESLYLGTIRHSRYLHTIHFIDIGYNRLSYKLYKEKLNLRVNRIGNLILMQYRDFSFDREEDWDIHADSSFCFILSQMHLVEVMRHFVV